MDKIAGMELLKGIIDKEIRHEDYDRVTKLADKYYKLKTGDGIEDLLKKVEGKVTDEEFDRIKDIYRSIIPGTLNATKLPYQKAVRKLPIVRKIEFESDSETKEAELEMYVGQYWGDKSLEKYLEYAFIDYNYIDPNAFLITEFDEFNPKIEKASPYPFVADSAQAIMFEYKNEILQYLVVKLPVKYTENDVEHDGEKYTMYLGPDTIVMSQVGNGNVPEGADTVIEIRSKYYAVYYYQPKAEKVPAIRFGYLRDEVTKGRTFVSVFHSVIGFLEKTLKIDSELDLSTNMVAFPQRFQYVTPCANPGCNKGFMPDQKECDVCHGTGVQTAHRGTFDIMEIALPRNATPDQLIDLNNLLVYKYPPIELLTFQKEYLEYLKQTAYELMFNVDRFTRSQVSMTATESIQGQDNMNDTLYPFARHYSSVWEFAVKDIATFTDLGKGLEVQHKFPNDFKFKTLSDLMTELKQAKDAGASTSTISAIEDDINEILYSDRPGELKEIKVKNNINPFRGYSEANIRFIISQGNTTLYNRTLWENIESIFQELERENENPWIYDMEEKKINDLVKVKTEEYIARITGERDAQAEKEMNQLQPFRNE